MLVDEKWPTRRLFGVPIHALRMVEVLSIVDETIERHGRLLIGVVNAAKLVNMGRDPVLDRAVRRADMILADGMGVVFGCWLLRRRLPERVTGIDLMERMLERGSGHGLRVYFLGATEAVLQEMLTKVAERYPGIIVAGSHHGYFTEAEEPSIVAGVRASEASVLFVAMSSPKKEVFLSQWADALGVPVCHGVGGAFDVLAGKVVRASSLWQRLGLEWLHRVLQEPRRMWRRYLVTNTLFIGKLLGEFVGRRGSDRA